MKLHQSRELRLVPWRSSCNLQKVRLVFLGFFFFFFLVCGKVFFWFCFWFWFVFHCLFVSFFCLYTWARVSISLFHFLKDHLCMCVFLSSLNSVMTRSLRFCVRPLENYFLHARCLNSTSKISYCSIPAPPPPFPQESTPWLPWGP